MAQYRVVQYGGDFYPEVRRWWFPFWLTTCNVVNQGGGAYPEVVSSLEEAQQICRNHSQRGKYRPPKPVVHQVIP